MMLEELRIVFDHAEPGASRSDYMAAIVDANVLGKPTRKARELTLRHLTTLYGFDTSNPIFRALRRLWPLNREAQPMLALAVALARDPLLAATQSFVLSQPVGGVVRRETVEAYISQSFPDRFSPASLKSFAQNISGSWTSGGLLSGRVQKVRTIPSAFPESVTMLLFLGYLYGRTGQRLFSSHWTALIGRSTDELEELANSAAIRGLIVFMQSGGIKEVRFPGFLLPEEEQVLQEVRYVF
ncbi:MAG: hypothetical protein H6994_03795 [Pseudomonadales bacterium]|nr:hypothetical protein [Pseudomonadales bacterium]